MICGAAAHASAAAGRDDVFAWFAPTRRSSTLFVAGLTGGTGVVPEPGRSPFATSVQGYSDAWPALPGTVSAIVVLRDTPKFHGDTDACVTARRRGQASAGPHLRARPPRSPSCATPAV